MSPMRFDSAERSPNQKRPLRIDGTPPPACQPCRFHLVGANGEQIPVSLPCSELAWTATSSASFNQLGHWLEIARPLAPGPDRPTGPAGSSRRSQGNWRAQQTPAPSGDGVPMFGRPGCGHRVRFVANGTLRAIDRPAPLPHHHILRVRIRRNEQVGLTRPKQGLKAGRFIAKGRPAASLPS